jgi:hypothetical protein
MTILRGEMQRKSSGPRFPHGVILRESGVIPHGNKPIPLSKPQLAILPDFRCSTRLSSRHLGSARFLSSPIFIPLHPFDAISHVPEPDNTWFRLTSVCCSCEWDLLSRDCFFPSVSRSSDICIYEPSRLEAHWFVCVSAPYKRGRGLKQSRKRD